jgi:hypothetical protein
LTGYLNLIQICDDLGTFGQFPPAVRSYVVTALAATQSDIRQSIERRSRASFEYAIALITFGGGASSSSGEDPETIKALEALHFAAENGCSTAQWLFGWIRDALCQNDVKLQLPVDQESRWLVDGMKAGSRVAATRLYRLNEEEWKQTLCTVRQSYRGIGGDSYYLDPHESQWHGPSGLWYFSATGNDKEVHRILSENPEAVNTHFVDGETALLAACRSAHANVVQLLLENGADASLTDDWGKTPLHFISSFDNQEAIATVASALVKRNGDLEAWAYHPVIVNDSVSKRVDVDTIYGYANTGTPLTWAVTANCLDAVVALLELGAEPCPTIPQSVLLSARRHFTPMHWAARMHQSEILVVLLDYACAKSKCDKATILNTKWEINQTGLPVFSPLGQACFTAAGAMGFSRLLLHGSKCLQEHHSELELDNFCLLAGCAARQRATLRLKGTSCICCR